MLSEDQSGGIAFDVRFTSGSNSSSAIGSDVMRSDQKMMSPWCIIDKIRFTLDLDVTPFE